MHVDGADSAIFVCRARALNLGRADLIKRCTDPERARPRTPAPAIVAMSFMEFLYGGAPSHLDS